MFFEPVARLGFGGKARRRLVSFACLPVVAALLSACGAAGVPAGDPAAVQPPQPRVKSEVPVGLGAVQQVDVAASFGPGTGDVPASITVFAVRDHVASNRRIRPIAPRTHWASADVKVCRSAPVIFGYPAWVLGDDSGRTAQQTRVVHPQFPQPVFPNNSTTAGCARGWVTWVTPDNLTPTKVSFEQARTVSAPWRLR